MTAKPVNALLGAALARAQRAVVKSSDTSDLAARRAEYDGERRKRMENLIRAQPRITAYAARLIVAGTLRRSVPLVAVRRWLRASDGPALLCLAGVGGAGKSVAGANELIALRAGSYVHAEDLELFSTTRWGDQRDDVRRRLGGQYIVLDDLGTERDAAAMAAALYRVADTAGRRKILVTTNLGADALRRRYAEPRLWDRLAATWALVPCLGPSLRSPLDTRAANWTARDGASKARKSGR